MELKKSIYSALRRMKRVCSGTPGLRWITKLNVVKSIIAFFRKRDPNILGQFELFDQFYVQHQEEFSAVYGLLADDFSRSTWETLIQCRRTGKMDALKDFCVEPQYFRKDIFGPVENEVFVDGGAYLGDTIEAFIKFTGGGYKKYMLGNPLTSI